MEEEQAKATTRRQILEVAADILERGGARAVSTRSVAAAAGIRAASLYQYFGDKDGLLSALAVHAFDLYLARKHELRPTDDPVADIRRGWDAHVEFGLDHPALYLLMYGTDHPGRRPPAAERAQQQLRAFLDHVADTGRLRVPPVLAAELLVAGVTGVTLALIGEPSARGTGVRSERCDPQLSATMRETLIDTLTTSDRAADPPRDSGLASRALTLDAALDAGDRTAIPLRPTETALLRDWLHRLAHPAVPPPRAR